MTKPVPAPQAACSFRLSVVMITLNEEDDLPRAMASVPFATEWVIVDSGSQDGTVELAKSRGAKVIQTSDWPGFGPQKNRALDASTGDWVLSLDADEWLSPELAEEIQGLLRRDADLIAKGLPGLPVQAYWLPRKSDFIDQTMRFGDWRGDRVLRLFRRGQARFTDDQIHERLELTAGGKAGVCRSALRHWSVKTLQESEQKMWDYNVAGAERLAVQGRGGLWAALGHAAFGLFRGLVLRLGVLDGRRGLQLAWLNARGTWLRYSLAGEKRTVQTYKSGHRRWHHRLHDWMSMMFEDHGVLRSLHNNHYELRGGLHRVNQPGPRQIEAFHRKYGIKTLINLRGANPQHGWFRLEEETCRRLGIQMINTQVYSRGLVSAEQLANLRGLIQNMELPALVHCKSGADRAGFFSVLYRIFRLKEPVEQAKDELHWRYGHFRSAKTGVLDYFFETYLQKRKPNEDFMAWVERDFDPVALESDFKPMGWTNWLVDKILRRE